MESILPPFSTDAPAPAENAIFVEAGYRHSFALDANGALWGWGAGASVASGASASALQENASNMDNRHAIMRFFIKYTPFSQLPLSYSIATNFASMDTFFPGMFCDSTGKTVGKEECT